LPKRFASAVLTVVEDEKMFGVDEVVRLCIVALYTDGHVLLEGNPGMGKTELVKTLSRVLELEWGRIQFTPDLMPSDVTGTMMPDTDAAGTRRFVFQEGPIFTSLLLADEINRATPKTQSAMLEAMAERQVTGVDGKRRPLPSPFMVLATQNPIDHEGTYQLPEAQADRFMFKIAMPSPDASVLRQIMGKQTGVLSSVGEAVSGRNGNHAAERGLLPANHAESQDKYKMLRGAIQRVVPLGSVETHVTNMYLASGQRWDELVGLESKQKQNVQYVVKNLMAYGLGPRAVIAMLLGAKAWTLFFSSNANEYADGPALARVVIPTLRHRFKLQFDWDVQYDVMPQRSGPAQAGRLERLIGDFCRWTAPSDRANREYLNLFERELDRVLAERAQ
jgi:MoxR-like ATPase